MIKKLPPEVVNQIAAGEVVERPSSVVKELIENAIDAGATSIRVEIQAGGVESIRIVDDGAGFLPEDLPLAFASHATSKLTDVGDLDHIGSLGFRGEALASIGAVSRAAIKSRRAGAREGWEIRCDGGRDSAVQPCGCPEGTAIEIRDLFFNVPARRRFLKSPGAEKARIQEITAELALARLETAFTFVAEGKEVLRLPAGESLAARFARCFGQELSRGLLPVSRRFDGLAIEGVIAEPDLARRDGKLELCFVNGRLARENSALYAIRQAYREYLMGGRFPVYALSVVLPADQVDVNVHPRKAEVRFVDSRAVAGRLHETVRAGLLGRQQAVAGDAGGIVVRDLPRARSGFPSLAPNLFGPPRPAPAIGPVSAGEPATGAPAVTGMPAASGASTVREAAPTVAAAARDNPFRGVGGRFLQVLDLYLLLEGSDGLLVVDQHALHERVLYEQLCRDHAARAVAVQRLVVPAVVEVTPSELAWLLEAAESLASAGLLVDQMGPGSVAVHGVPLALARTAPAKLLRALLDDEGGDGRARVKEQVAERFHSMACRAAVMSGDRLGEAEIAALLAAAATLEHPHNCPHGRPTVLTFGRAELERYFRRRC